MSIAPSILATYRNLDWPPYVVQTWRGSQWPVDVPVAAASCMLEDAAGRLVLVDVRSRGWDVPGGRLAPAEDVLDALHRELREEAGVQPAEYSTPDLLGWLLVNPAENTVVLLYFHATLAGQPVLATEVPDEVADVALFARSEIPTVASDRAWYPLLT